MTFSLMNLNYTHKHTYNNNKNSNSIYKVIIKDIKVYCKIIFQKAWNVQRLYKVPINKLEIVFPRIKYSVKLNSKI